MEKWEMEKREKQKKVKNGKKKRKILEISEKIGKNHTLPRSRFMLL